MLTNNEILKIKPKSGYILLMCAKYILLSIISIIAGIKYHFIYCIHFAIILQLAAIYVYLSYNAITYTVKNELLCVEKGLLSKNISYMELFRIEDIEIRQPINIRMFGYSDIWIFSADLTTKITQLQGVSVNECQKIAEYIRDKVLNARKHHRIYGVNNV